MLGRDPGKPGLFRPSVPRKGCKRPSFVKELLATYLVSRVDSFSIARPVARVLPNAFGCRDPARGRRHGIRGRGRGQDHLFATGGLLRGGLSPPPAPRPLRLGPAIVRCRDQERRAPPGLQQLDQQSFAPATRSPPADPPHV